MNIFKKLFAVLALTLSGAANAVVPAVCTGQFFNPMSDTDWNTIFPITIAGAEISNGVNQVAPLMRAMPPVCVCPTIFGFPFFGIGITYWQPLFISEIERRPGCMPSLGGVQILQNYSSLGSEQTTSDVVNQGEGSNRMQIHWYEYPIFAMLDMMSSLGCKSSSGYNLAYVTEIDPLWQDDTWGAIFSPESSLFVNPLSHLACAVDAVASSLGFPMDPLFWCAGSWGNLYPLAGNSQSSGDPFQMNNQINAKFLARNSRLGLANQTIGPTAMCSSHPNPVWIKSQYRLNQVAPIRRKGRAILIGDHGRIFTYPPVTNTPTNEHSINLIWQGQQCCVKPIP